MRARCAECAVLHRLFCRGLKLEQIAELSCIFRPKQVARHQLLYSGGQAATQIFALHSGSVKITRAAGDGRVRITRIVRAGELFGLEALGDAAVYPTTATMAAGGAVCIAPREEFLQVLRARPDIGESMVVFLLGELDRLRDQFTRMSFQDARGRVALYLGSLLPPGTAPNASVPVKLGLSRQEIGEVLDLSPETVSRALSSFQKEGILTAHGRRLQLLDPEKLQQIADS